MQPSFWQERWATKQIGFHEGKPNDLLAGHVPLLEGRRRVLVPLCGKATDMLLLASLGMQVVGAEFVETACREFFADNALPHRREGDRFVSDDGRIILVCADMFAGTRELLGGSFDAVYDRAALVAIEPSMRTQYVDAIANLLEPAARTLLVTFAYDQTMVQGPPWSISDADVHALYAAKAAKIERVATRALVPRPRMLAAGVTTETESLYVIDYCTPRPLCVELF